MQRLGIDPSTPLAVRRAILRRPGGACGAGELTPCTLQVQQWNGLIAVNYPARVFGITRHESPADALLKCPELMLVHCATYRQGDKEPGYWGDNPKPETHKVSHPRVTFKGILVTHLCRRPDLFVHCQRSEVACPNEITEQLWITIDVRV